VDNSFFTRPIFNSPYEYPARHWELDAAGQPTQKIVKSRRPADFIVGPLGSESYPEFLRVFWDNRHRALRKAGPFKTVLSENRDRSTAFALIRDTDRADLNFSRAAHIYSESSHVNPEN